jgi:predicted DNA-binding transcriptional regulator AlpA
MTVDTTTDSLTFSIPELCRVAGFSVRTFHKLRARGDGPPVVKIGNRTLVRRKTAERWLADRERIARNTEPRELALDGVYELLCEIVSAPDDARVARWASYALDALEEARGISTKRLA